MLARKGIVTALLSIAAAAMVSSSSVGAPTTWHTGDEAAWTGHTFAEEYWTADIQNTTADNASVTFSASWVNTGSVQAFLLAFKEWEKDGNKSTLPYQLFGMHFKSPEGREVFLGAVFAFLMAFNDTYTAGGGHGLPNPGQEDVYYVLPFGVARDYLNSSYPPVVEAIPAEKLGEGHYKFGISYKNLYAKIIGANSVGEFWLSSVLPIYVMRFSELTVTYEITIDAATHTASAETWYTIGEIQELWVWGQKVDPHNLSSNFGLAAVHYGVVFTSDYAVEDAAGSELSANFDGPVGDNLTLRIRNHERFAKIGFRGTFDLLDEQVGGGATTVSTDNQAYNAIVKARPADRLLVGWQHGLSADIFSVFAFGNSENIRAGYSSPQDLRQRASENFTGQRFWYAVSFPHFAGYRIVHDPTYDAYYSDPAPAPAPRRGLPGFEAPLAMAAVGSVGVLAVLARRREE
ncbi:MAG TPA: hypothetical protein VJ547_09635 [Candidatus Thermoplasmatota archaeon]|nr:hypothetical protein [Candidatus Thermoplasmatota archaeon]